MVIDFTFSLTLPKSRHWRWDGSRCGDSDGRPVLQEEAGAGEKNTVIYWDVEILEILEYFKRSRELVRKIL